MKHLKRYNEQTAYGDDAIHLYGGNQYSSPFTTPGLKVTVGPKYQNYKEVPGEYSIRFQTNEHGVVIDSPEDIDNLIHFLMEQKDKLI